MSGIYGIYHSDGNPIDIHNLDLMGQSMKHRGPDGNKIWHSDNAGMGCQQLWTTPEAVGKIQPVESTDGTCILTADARIDNRDLLIKLIGDPYLTDHNTSDEQVILQAYQKWGVACLEKLDGDFAFAIWDQTEKHIFAARDHLGAKPLFYYYKNHVFIFASEIKAILSIPGMQARIYDKRIADFLFGTYTDIEPTSFTNINRLPAANYLIVNENGLYKKEYWALNPRHEINYKNAADYSKHFFEIFSDAVKKRLRSSHPFGIALSGGLDSSSIACTTQNYMGNDIDHGINLYTSIFVEDCDTKQDISPEQAYIDAVIDSGGFNIHYVPNEYGNLIIEPDIFYNIIDELYFAPTISMFWRMYSNLNDHGLRIFLEGVDGDIVIPLGLERLPELVINGKWITFISETRSLLGNGTISGSVHSAVWNHGIKPIVSSPFKYFLNTLGFNKIKDPFITSLLNPDFANNFSVEENQKPNYSPFQSERYSHYQKLTSPSIQLSLELLNMVASYYAIEVRYPFFDRQLIEYCLSLPAKCKLFGGWTRKTLRDSMSGILPEKIRRRSTKADYEKYYIDELKTKAISHELNNRGKSTLINKYLDISKTTNLAIDEQYVPTNKYAQQFSMIAVLLFTQWLEQFELKFQNSMVQ